MNVIKTNTTPDKSNNIQPYQHAKIDWRGLALFAVVLAVVIFIPWLIFLATAGIMNWLTPEGFDYSQYIFWAGPTLWVVIMSIALWNMIPALQEGIKNIAFRPFAGILMHRDDIRSNAKELIPIGMEYGKGSTSTGAETYSPTFHYQNQVTANKDAANTGDIYSPHVKAQDEIDVLALLPVLRGKDDE